MLDQIIQPPAIDSTTFRLSEDEYVNQSVPKDLIVLHYTAGTSARSVYSTWTQRPDGAASRVAAAYVVDLDGTIYEFFPPDKWAYHLGMTVRNPAYFNDRRSIAIEIVNPGPLRPDADNPDQLNWWPDNFSHAYCATDETERYVRAPFRGLPLLRHVSRSPDAGGSESGRPSLRPLQHPEALAPVNRRNEYDPNFFCSFRGIAAHQNFRPDKADIGPAWKWQGLS